MIRQDIVASGPQMKARLRALTPGWRVAMLVAICPFIAVTSSCAHEVGAAGSYAPVAWRFDRVAEIGGVATRSEGAPLLIATDAGKAIRFDGKDDAIFVEKHPLAGAATFTIEAIFRPDGGSFEQRWLHLAEAGGPEHAGIYPPVPPSGPRFLFEIRVVPQGWYLDAFAAGPGYSQALMAPEKLHRLGRWHHVAQSYDGRTYRSYVDGVLQAEAPLAFVPHGQGFTSIGTRINRRNYFNGAVYSARFTSRALSPSEFMRMPPALR